MHIFYSWLSDCPAETNRTFIRKALDLAVSGIQASNVDEADRSENDIVVDQDTQDVLGSPNITETIFRKISDTNVFAADVTLSGKTPAGKKVLNSNVAIELGYALGKHDYECLLMIMNTEYGSPSKLPFDLQGRRFPLTYKLARDATPDEIQGQLDTLVDKLKPVLLAYARAHIASQPTVPTPEFEKTPPTLNRGRFWSQDEKFVPLYGPIADRTGNKLLGVEPVGIIYLRLFPKVPQNPITPKECEEFAYGGQNRLRPMGVSGGWTPMRNRYGAIVYKSNSDASQIESATQLFENREIWAFDTRAVTFARERAAQKTGNVYLPSSMIVKDLGSGLSHCRASARDLGYPNEYSGEIGIVGLEGTYLGLEKELNMSFEEAGPFYKDVFLIEFDLSPSVTNSEIVERFISGLFSEVGWGVPNWINDDLKSFPTLHDSD